MAEVFISYSTKDEEIANMVCNALESSGIKCWIAPRDITGGANWQPSITEAISESRVFIVIYSENSAQSPQVARELALADERSDHPRTIIPYKIDNTELVAGFKYYLVSSQWVTVDIANNDFKTESLISSVNKALGKEDAKIVINNVTINAHIHNSDKKEEEQVVYTTSDATEATSDNVTSREEVDAFFDSIKVTTVETSSSVQSSPVRTSGGMTVNNPAPVQTPVNNAPTQPAMSTSSAKPLPVKTIAIAGGILLAVILLIVLIVSLAGGGNGEASGNSQMGTSSSQPQGNGNSEGVVYFPEIKPYENHEAKVLENSYEETFKVLGKEYNTGIVLNAFAGSYVIFNCDGYDKVKFTVARVDNTEKGENAVRVFADEKELNAVKTDQFSAPQTVEYDISGKSQLRIAINQSNTVRADIALTDIWFYNDGEVAPDNSSQDGDSADLVAVPSEKKPYENHKTELLDNSFDNSYFVLGKEYNTGVMLNANDGSYIIFDNSEDYETLYLTAAKTDNTARGENYIRVYADDKELERMSFGQFSSPTSMEYDIKGAKQIRIAVEQNHSSPAILLLYDMYFAKNGAKPEISKDDTGNASDLVAVPAEKTPYENFRSEVFTNSLDKKYYVLGKEYNTGVMLDANGGSYVVFNNDGNYETLYLTAAKTDNTAKGDNYIRVYADGTELELMSFGKLSSPVSMEYNIKGAKQIRIAVEQNHSSPAIMLVYDMYFAKNGKKPEVKVEDNSNLPDLVAVPSEKKPYENHKSKLLVNDLNESCFILGKEHKTGIRMNAYEASYVVFDNNEGYETLYLTAAKCDNTGSGENYIRVIADGNELQPIVLGKYSVPQSIEYNIKGVKQITLTVDQNNTSRADILLYNMYFAKNGKSPEAVVDKTEYADLAIVPTDHAPYENTKSGIYSNDVDNKFMVSGKEYNTGIVLNAFAGSEFALYNHGKYEKLCLTMSKVDGTAEGGNEVCIRIDGIEEYYSLTDDSEPQKIELDLKGKKQVVFKITESNSVRADILLYNMYFSKNGAKPQ